ncbi:MAG: transposase [Candidatus Melainabacteria bacterium]|nr:transposase [Candidatus Melainabacteria bacterium]
MQNIDVHELFKNKYRIKSTRLPNWNYSSDGFYFITICTKNRKCFFGNIINGQIELSEIGKIVQKYWQEIPQHFENVSLDEFVIMPNHLHGIVVIENCRMPIRSRDGVTPSLQQRPTLGQIIGYFKYQTTKIINQIRNMSYVPIWQPRFYDHIIRDEKSLNSIRNYIKNNPIKWNLDRNNSNNLYM